MGTLHPLFRRIFVVTLGASLGCVSAPSAVAQEAQRTAHASPPAALSLSEQIDALIGQPRFAGADWGISVISLDSGRTLYAHRADQLFQPASTSKLFTAAVTLGELGPDYRIPTRVLATSDIRNGRLNGPLVLYGMGDPTLGADASTAQWADQLATQLAAQGLRHVHGDLVADATYFASPAMGTGWEAIDLQSWFAVPATALSVRENQAEVTISPAASAGMAANVSIEPGDAIPSVISEVTTSAAHSRAEAALSHGPPGGKTDWAGAPRIRRPLPIISSAPSP